VIQSNMIHFNRSEVITLDVKAGKTTDRSLFEAAFNHAADAMMIIDGANGIAFVNDALVRMTGWRKDTIVGRLCSEVFSCQGGAARETRGFCDTISNRGSMASQTQCNFIDERGKKVTLCMIHTNIAFPNDEKPYKVVVVLDAASQRRRAGITGDAIATASHELLSPLNLIRGYATTVSELDESLTPDERRRYLRGIEFNVTRAAQLIRDFLEMPRLEAESLFLTVEPTLLPDLLRRVVTEIQNQSVDHVITLHAPRWLPLVNVDRKKIERVMTNLLFNAVKYSPPGSDIIVSARGVSHGDEETGMIGQNITVEVPCLIIAIEDSGTGIPEDDIELVFEKFHRVDNTRTRASSGAGIGLYICKILVEAHGGRIWARSKVGEGSVFTFTLPLIQSVSADYRGFEHAKTLK